jgi:hypothetical protein
MEIGYSGQRRRSSDPARESRAGGRLRLSTVAIVDRRQRGCNTLDPEAAVGAEVRLHGRDFAGPKLLCIDLHPYTTTQAPDRSDILNVGGSSDAVFSVVAAFLADDSGRFVAEVDAVELWQRTPPVHVRCAEGALSTPVAVGRGRDVRGAWACGTLEDNRTGLPLTAGFASCELPPRRVATIRLLP